MPDKSASQKLLIKENYTVLLLNEPDNYQAALGDSPQNVTVLTEVGPPVDLVQLFLTSRSEFEGNCSSNYSSIQL